MPNITDLVTERPKTDVEMNHHEKNNIDEAIHKNLRNKDVYESELHKIYNIIVVQTNKKLQ